jgi:hypothetical protein
MPRRHRVLRTLLRAPALIVAALALVLAGVATTVAAPGGRTSAHKKRHTAKPTKALTKADVGKLIAAYIAAHPPAAGARGPAGPSGAAGSSGATGAQGPPGPTTTMAPSGSTQIGTVGAEGTATGAGQYVDTSISFALRLASAPTVVEVPWGGSDPNCSGTPGSPAARPGYLCIYIRDRYNVHQGTAGYDLYPQEPGNLNFGASPFGVLLSVDSAGPGPVWVLGSWAVTAP